MKRKLLSLLATAVFATGAQASIVISEVMYDPAGGNEHEFVELYNTGDMTIDLTGYVISDDPSQTLPNSYTLTGGSIAAGETALLVRIDTARTLANYQNAWGNDLNFIEIPAWPVYTNGGDTVALYSPDDTMIASVDYRVSNGFPAPNDSASVYILDAEAATPYAASNWALSQDGVDGAYYGNAPRASDIASPGFVTPEPASAALLAIGALFVAHRRSRR